MRMIDADAAIESLTEYGNGRAVYIGVEEAVRRIEQLPSAQPETNCSEIPNNSDTISEQALLKALETVKTAKLEIFPSIQPEQRWIPVTERLPEVGSCVLCFLSYPRYMGQYRVCKYRPADKYVDHPYFDFNENGFPNVVAWMPLPEIYQEGGEQDG